MAKINTDTNAYLKNQGISPESLTGSALPGAGAQTGSDPTPIIEPDPLPEWLGNIVYPLTQSWVADIPEAGQQIAAGRAVPPPNINIPLGPFGTINPQTILKRATSTPLRQAVRTGGDIVNVPAMIAAGPAGEVTSLGALASRAPSVVGDILATPAAQTGIKAILGAEAQPVEPGTPDFWSAKGRQAAAAATLTAAGSKAADALAKRQAATTQPRLAAIGQDVVNQGRYQDQVADLETRRGQAAQFIEQRRNRFMRETAAHGEEVAKRTEAHAQLWEDWDKQAEARKGLDAQQNVSWMRRALDTVGLGDKTPTTAGDEALNTTRDLIGGKLNEANSQLSFDPIETDALARIQDIAGRTRDGQGGLLADSSKTYWDNVIRSEVLPSIAVRDEKLGRWNEKPTMPGQDFADTVTRLNGLADRLAKTSKFPNAVPDQLKMADALHDIVNLVLEDGATGPQAALQLRDQAREGYRIYSTLGHAADPAKESIATSTQVVNEMKRRAGTNDRYRGMLAEGHPDAAHASQWLYESRQPLPEKPPSKPDLPPPPKEPEYEKLRFKGKEAKPPTPPPETPRPEPPQDRTARGPWAEVAKRTMHYPAMQIGSRLGEALGGHPWWGAGVGLAASEALVHPQTREAITRALASGARAPYRAGAIAGQVGADPTAPVRWGAQAIPSAAELLMRQLFG